MDELLDAYKDMWGKDKDFYVLRDNGDSVYSIIDVENNSGVIIENEAVAREVVRRMLNAGVFVGDPFDLQTKKEIIRRRIQARKGCGDKKA
jgi:hypothetical protein